MSPAPPPQPPPASEESADLFDYALLRDHLGFTLRAVGRHPGVALLVLASVVGASVEGLRVLPRTYHAETKLLAQRNQVMGAIGNPNRSIPWDADAPTRAAQETVLRHDNLVLLVKQTDLLDGWERTRAPAVRLKDWVVRRFTGPMNDDDRMEALIGLLEKRLYVETGDQTVTIAVDWPDAQAAFRLVEAAQQNFLETRHVSEIAIISEAISILEGHATSVHEAIESTMDELQQKLPPAPHAEPVAHRPVRRKSPEDQELAQLRVMLNSKKQAIKDVEDFRQRRLTELQTQLTEARAIYAPAHPAVLNLQQSIEALSKESPQVAALRREQEQLEEELDRRGKSAAAEEQGARRAGVDGLLTLARLDATAPQRDFKGPGLVIANLPYGKRVGRDAELESLYRGFAAALKQGVPGWRVALFAADAKLLESTGIAWIARHRVDNGGIPCVLAVGTL